MYQKKLPVTLKCGLHLFKEVLTGKWKMMLINYIFSGYKRPGEIQRMIPSADRRVLDIQLKELTSYGLITKKELSRKPLIVNYELTALGESLMPVIQYIDQWGEDHREELEHLIKAKVDNIFAVI